MVGETLVGGLIKPAVAIQLLYLFFLKKKKGKEKEVEMVREELLKFGVKFWGGIGTSCRAELLRKPIS